MPCLPIRIPYTVKKHEFCQGQMMQKPRKWELSILLTAHCLDKIQIFIKFRHHIPYGSEVEAYKQRFAKGQTIQQLTSSPKGNDRSPESNVPRVNVPQNLMQPSPHPNNATHNIWSSWPTGFRDIQVQKCEIFVTQGQVTPKWVVWFGPKSNSTEFLCLSWLPATLMMIQSKMNELA